MEKDGKPQASYEELNHWTAGPVCHPKHKGSIFSDCGLFRPQRF
jgi:hypothetical protein